jgi:hypothetical protein
MIAARYLLLTALRNPESTLSLSLAEWDVLVRQARRADLLARLCVFLREQDLLDEVPSEARNHLESEIMLAESHERSVRWEGFQIRRSLEDLDIPVILLKGAAYVLGELPARRGRLFYDVDILVPKSELDAVERQLALHGWTQGHLDAYDQRYYRQFSHQLPPLRHVKRNTVLDVHHAILPETARLSPDPQRLLAAAVPLNGHGCLKIFAPTDMVLHSATHLFQEGEFDHGLRDLVDLDILFRHFGRDEAFWSDLLQRAKELDLARPLYYALRYTRAILGTPIPEQVEDNSRSAWPKGIAPAFMDGLFTRALAPDHPSCERSFAGLARWLLYMRGHALRMPMHLLIPHLIRKALKRRKDAWGIGQKRVARH